MVFFFVCFSDPSIVIYMGKDKFENEDLIKYAWPGRDIWFHVDNLSSAHVYLRLPHAIKSFSEIPDEIIQECAQLTKANSIQGCKKASCGINYTWARNLLKQIGMETGSVSFHNPSEVKRIAINKDKDIVKRIMKTKREEHPNFELELRDHLTGIQQAESAVQREEFKAAKDEKKAAIAKKEERKADLESMAAAQADMTTSN